jgi:phytoene/squalene synthetase
MYMPGRSAALARSITWDASKQSYLTARLMVDSGLVDDAMRAYAYFRWVDDYVDVHSQSKSDSKAFTTRQLQIIESLFRGDHPPGLSREEEIVADLISRHRTPEGGLHSYIRKMMGIIDFDAQRRGELVSADKLAWYSQSLGTSVVDAIQFFIGNDQSYPETNDRYLAGIAAHIAHMLRDMRQDIADGFVNIPREYIQQHNIKLENFDQSALRAWVRNRVDESRSLFRKGKRYLDKLGVLRVKIVGYWYAARFDGVLDTIERDGYVLREDYGNRRRLGNWLRMASVATSTALRHVRK